MTCFEPILVPQTFVLNHVEWEHREGVLISDDQSGFEPVESLFQKKKNHEMKGTTSSSGEVG